MRHPLFLVFVLFTALLSTAAQGPFRDAHVEAELIPETEALQPGRSLTVLFRFRMDPGWHIYWKNPGDSGLAVSVKWSLPEGFRAEPMEWPFPETFHAGPLTSYGYSGEAVLAQKILIPKTLPAGSDIELRAGVEWLACMEDCIPGRAQFQMMLPVTNSTVRVNSRWAELYRKTSRFFPQELTDPSATAEVRGQTLQLRFSAPKNISPDQLQIKFYPYDSKVIAHNGKQKGSFEGDDYVLTVQRSPLAQEPLIRLRGVLVVSDEGANPSVVHALKIDVPVKSFSLGQKTRAGHSGFFLAVLFAFLGGLVLNLMPCVLPVLSLKIFHFVEQAKKNPSGLLQHGIFYTLGVLFVFWMLACFLIIFRLWGYSLGWGFQLQFAPFVLFLILLFFMLAMNLLGVFEMGLVFTRLGAVSQKQVGGWSAFLSGGLITVVATPCSAPFMGAALGFAMTQPGWVVLVTLTSLGLGVAAPYLTLCFFPRLGFWMPKPGAWMLVLKKVLAIPLLATMLWLCWVLSEQRGVAVLGPTAAGLILVGGGLWAYGRSALEKKSRWKRSLARGSSILLVLFGILVPLQSLRHDPQPFSPEKESRSSRGIPWESFSQERLEVLRRQGRLIFIDFTAAWCLTCQVNELLALHHPKVIRRFEELEVVALKADWTSRDETVTRALAGYGRNSIPLYVFYGENSREPVLLSEVITAGEVLQVLQEIRKK